MKRNDLNPFDAMNNNNSKKNEQIIMASGSIKSLEVFADTIREAVATVLGDEYDVSLQVFEEVNDSKHCGLFIESSPHCPGPIFPLDMMYKDYLKGKISLYDVVSKILSEYEDAKEDLGAMDIREFDCFEEVKDHIYPRLVNKDKNKDMDCIRIPFGDFMIIFAVCVMSKGSLIGSIKVSKAIMEEWDIGVKELIKTAYRNLEREEMMVRSMEEELEPIKTLIPEKDNTLLKNGLFTVSKKEGMFGAVYMTTPYYLDEICIRTAAEAIYILPIATYMLIVFPEKGVPSKRDGILLNMIRAAIEEGIPEEYALSDDIYKYNASTKELVNVFDDKRRDLFSK